MGEINMRLYTYCRHCGQKIYLQIVVLTRRDLPSPLTTKCLYCRIEDHYFPYDVYAEPGAGAPIAGAALGAIVGGLIGGPIGLLLGGALGGTAGAGSEQRDREAAQRFNEEVV